MTPLKQCKTLDDLFRLTSSRLTLQSCRWGGWTVSDGTASYSSYQLTLKLNELFLKSVKNRKTATTTLKIADRIHQINRAARQSYSPWYRILLTLIRLWIENLTYHHHRTLITVTQKAQSILNDPPPKKRERSLHTPFSSDILDDEPDNTPSLSDPSEELEDFSGHKDVFANPYTLNIDALKGKRQPTETFLIFCKLLNEKILTFSMTDYKHATVKTFLDLTAKKCSAPVDDLRFYLRGKVLNHPDHLNKPLSHFDFRTAGGCYLIVRKAGTSKKIDDLLKQSAKPDPDHSCLEELEAGMIRLETAVLKNNCPQFHSDVGRIEKTLEIVSTELKDDQEVVEAVQELQQRVTRTKSWFHRGPTDIAERWKTVFEKIVEDDLELYPPITCEAKTDEPIFKLVCNKHHCIFHREALQSQIGNGPLADDLTDQAQREIGMNIDPEIFSCLTAYLYDGNAPQTLDSLSEVQLVEFYELAFQLLIPRLEIQCALEIMKKTASSNWNDHDLLIPYLDRDETVLGKMMKIYG